MPKDTVEDPTDDGTLRPDEKPISKVGSGFQPMHIEDREIEIYLPKGVDPEHPFSLFELYYTTEIIDNIVLSINHYSRDVGKAHRARGKQ